jgi:hypothetical protein
MPAREVASLLAGIAEALQEIHAAGLVHRDLKPSNVLLSADGPRVIDFGIARALEGVPLTGSGALVGSPQFMAPEQIRAVAATPALDVFALGSVTAFALLGRPPFGDDNAAAVMHRVLWEPPDLDGCPATWRDLLGSCLAKEPADRPSPGDIIALCQAGAEPAGLVLTWPPTDLPGSPPRETSPDPAPPVFVEAPVIPVASAPRTPHGPAAPRVIAATWLMLIAGALAVAGVVTGTSTQAALRPMLARQHPAAASAAIGSAIGLALIVLLVRGVAGAAIWGWAARRTWRRRPDARLLSVVAAAVAALGVADSYLQVLSTIPVRLVGVAGALAGLAGVLLAWGRPRRARPRPAPGGGPVSDRGGPVSDRGGDA